MAGWWNIGRNLAAAAAVLLIVCRFPVGAADLAAVGLIALGLGLEALTTGNSRGKVVARIRGGLVSWGG